MKNTSQKKYYPYPTFYTILSLILFFTTQFKASGPDFIILGAQKCGNTSLFMYLRQHPQIILPPGKEELNFFNRHYSKGLPWYEKHFPNHRPHGSLTGECSTLYLPNPLVPKRIFEVYNQKSIKFIVLLRNPVHRTISHYKHHTRKKQELRSLEDVIKTDLYNEPNYEFDDCNFHYIKNSLYAEQLEQWFLYFKKEQFFIIFSEDFFENPNKVIQNVHVFLGIAPTPLSGKPIIHNKNHLSFIPPKEIALFLSKLYEPYNKKLSLLINRDIPWD